MDLLLQHLPLSAEWYERHRGQRFATGARPPEEFVRALRRRLADDQVSAILLVGQKHLADDGSWEWRPRQEWWLARMGLLNGVAALLPVDTLHTAEGHVLVGRDISNEVMVRGAIEIAWRGYHMPMEEQAEDCKERTLAARRDRRQQLADINRETPWYVRKLIRDHATATYTREERVRDRRRQEQREHLAELGEVAFFDAVGRRARAA